MSIVLLVDVYSFVIVMFAVLNSACLGLRTSAESKGWITNACLGCLFCHVNSLNAENSSKKDTNREIMDFKGNKRSQRMPSIQTLCGVNGVS